MYSLNEIVIYNEQPNKLGHTIKSKLIDCNIVFKEAVQLKPLFSAIKNPQNYIIISISTKDTLIKIEQICKTCFNYQDRIFIIFQNSELNDNFFKNFCFANQIDNLEIFLNTHAHCKNIYPKHKQNLLYKLIELELKNLDIPTKYIGFKYLTQAVSNALSIDFHTDNYINIFQSIALSHLSTIDTIERDVRHMLSTTWKNSESFRLKLTSKQSIDKPNSKNILKAIVSYIRDII